MLFQKANLTYTRIMIQIFKMSTISKAQIFFFSYSVKIMNKNFSELINKIFESEELLKKITKAETFDELYDILKM